MAWESFGVVTFDIVALLQGQTRGGHGGRVVTLSPPTSAAGDRSPSWP